MNFIFTGCHRRCEAPFIESNGACVAYGAAPQGVDGGTENPPDPARPDAGRGPDGPLDAGVPDVSPVPGLARRLLIRGAAVLPMDSAEVIAPGEVYIEEERIACVGGVGVCEAEDAQVLETDGIVLPGLVDAHNHVAYNWLPEWESNRLWDDSRHWRGSSLYDAFISPFRDNQGEFDRFCAMVQWGEIRALVNGVTTIFGAPQARSCFQWLVRNPELSTSYNGWDADRMRTNTLGVTTLDPGRARDLLDDMNSGRVTAYMIHLAEGISVRARQEYLDLIAFGLLRPETILIHATGLAADDFSAVAASGAKVVWSPSSNMALYGETTDVAAALAAGVSVSIAPDWTPSGTDDVLAELQYARALIDMRWPGLLSDSDLVAMATAIPAAQMAIDRFVGTLEVGAYADVLVVDGDPRSPFESVVQAEPPDIRLVVLGGIPAYGEPTWMAALRDTPATCVDLDACGVARRACWANSPDGPVQISSLRDTIEGFFTPGPHGLFDCPDSGVP